MTDITTTTDIEVPHSGFDVRLIGQRNTLSVDVHRRDGDPAGEIVCDLAVSRVVGRDTHVDPVSFAVTGLACEDVASEAIRAVVERGHKIRNLTRFRYDLETSIGSVDIAIRNSVASPSVSSREELLSVSVRQVEQMIDELPLDVSGHVGRMMLDTFKSAVRNVIGAAYDTGYRDGLEDAADGSGTDGMTDDRWDGDDGTGETFDYDLALLDAELDAISL